MQTVKTAISLDKALFQRMQDAAQRMKIPRSRLVALALEAYLRQQENRALLAELNAAYAAGPDADEQELLAQARRSQGRAVEGEW